MLRIVSPPDHEWGCFVIWSDLDESDADRVIAEQVDFFRGLGRQFEWKWFGYDQPARSAAAAGEGGSRRRTTTSRSSSERSTRSCELCAGATVADGVTLRHVRLDDLDADFAGIVALNQKVWGEDLDLADGRAARGARRLARRPADPRRRSRATRSCCAAWVRFHTGTDFASLWGGSTLPEWRRKGIYRALVGRRAVQARDRGFRYLQVDASPDSRPILERLGLTVLTGTTPYMWTRDRRGWW